MKFGEMVVYRCKKQEAGHNSHVDVAPAVVARASEDGRSVNLRVFFQSEVVGWRPNVDVAAPGKDGILILSPGHCCSLGDYENDKIRVELAPG